ncbi:hypothetical protein D0784_05895 [Vibrio campbellii]|uniref:hypothetical protein n=1 Tax=Vibrio campbellii TaxID=680 RepID=UPI000EFD52F2|nr:hypothetical protein [Vibrio campbellii]AYO08964.1 hypothetical protein D0784_05895 [Vibrio campbellii]
MNRIVDIFRFTLISFEFLVFLLLLTLNYHYPEFFHLIGNKLKGNDELWNFIPLLPVAFLGVTHQRAQKVSAPLEGASNNQLYEWCSFHKVFDRILASYLICALCCIMSFSIWFFSEEINQNNLGLLLIISIAISGLTAFQISIASMKIRQVIEQYS